MTEARPLPSLDGDWYFEVERSGYAQGLRVKQRLLKQKTPFQNLEVVETDAFGRALILDDALQTSERDEFMYHEMLVHVALMTHPSPQRVLIIGGGDGGALRHVLQHPGPQPTQVEIDRAVIEACTAHLPRLADGAFDNPRARVVIGDGIEFMRNNPGNFDVIIVDSTDPVGPAVELFEEPFYRNVSQSLTDDGLVMAQSSSPLFMADDLRRQAANLRRVFPIVRTCLGIVPGYPGAMWSYTIGSKRYDPTAVERSAIAARLAEGGIQPRYYSPDIHHAAFVLPPFIAEILG